MDNAGWVAIIVAFLTGGGGLYTALTTKRKIDAESESVSVVTMTKVLNAARDELERCHKERAKVLDRLSKAERRIDSLNAYLRLNHDVNPEDINGE